MFSYSALESRSTRDDEVIVAVDAYWVPARAAYSRSTRDDEVIVAVEHQRACGGDAQGRSTRDDEVIVAVDFSALHHRPHGAAAPAMTK